jgi:hypothetical protein
MRRVPAESTFLFLWNPYIVVLWPISHHYGLFAILPGGGRKPRLPRDGVMLFAPERDLRSNELQDQLSRAQVVSPDLMSKVVAGARTRAFVPGHAARVAKIDRLIAAEAWTEAALVLVELELPQWRLRRLVYEEGAWLCSLGTPWNLPAWLGDCAETRHESLPLAILSALIEARLCGKPQAAGSVPRCRTRSSPPAEIMCCDNFA